MKHTVVLISGIVFLFGFIGAFAQDGLRAMDPNDILSLPINST